MYTILINAYSCSPNRGSEPGMAWNWIINLSRYCKVFVITEGQWRTEIEKSLINFEFRDNIVFTYNPISNKARKMASNQGDWRFYYYYKKWQLKTLVIAKEIIKNNQIDIIHQLNMIGFREPGYLWKIEGIPFVWGPVDAKEKFPVAYLKGSGLKTRLFIQLKNSITKLQLRYSVRVHQAVKKASVVVSASSNSQHTFHKYFKIDSPLLNETGCYLQEHPSNSKLDKNTLDVLWVGKLDFRKQLNLAIQTIAATQNKTIQLYIVGGGDNNSFKDLAKVLNIEDQCHWIGSISHSEVQQLMQKSDLFFFTSVAEGTPHVVLEAISNNLPVLCFDTCGQGDSVNDKVGVKIQLTNPKQSVIDFARELNSLYSDREILHKMSENCKERQLELSWDIKAQKMFDLYKCILKKTVSIVV